MRPCQIWDELRQRRCIYWGADICIYWGLKRFFTDILPPKADPSYWLKTALMKNRMVEGLSPGWVAAAATSNEERNGVWSGAATLQGVLVRLQELLEDLEEEWIESLCGTYKVRFWAPSLGDSLGQKIMRGRGGGRGAIAINMTIDFVCGAGPNAI